jgi:2-polyprenyl-6-methoxyphenol hydroxylase-like FAD-dependent oxidoreductase
LAALSIRHNHPSRKSLHFLRPAADWPAGNDFKLREYFMKVIIAGGGVGGLVTALMLHARGIDCEVFEQADGVRELGVGINTLPHAIKELAELGLLERLDAVAIRTYELFYTNRFGQEIWREPRGLDAGYDIPQFSIHRGRLQGVIYQAVRARLGESRIHLNCRLGSFTQDDGGVTAYFFDRNGAHQRTARGDILIGADGIHSVVREKLFPNEGPPSWNGLMLWRGAIDWPAFLTGRSMVVAGGLAAKLVIYPIAEGSRPDKRLTNWAIVGRVGDGSTPLPQKQDWSRPGRFEDMMPHLQRFRIPYLDARGLIEASNEFWEYPMCDRDPLPRWSHGRVTLLGDAAHPMYPVGSNGASQAILDARFLAERLKDAEHPVHALWTYEQTRLPMTAEIVRMNRRGGPEGVIDAVEARAPDGFSNIDDVLSFEQRKAIVRGYASAAGFAREQVNKAA